MKLVISNFPDQKEAEKMGKELVEAKLAACVNVVPIAKSYYYWKGKLVETTEACLIIKTADRVVEKIVGVIIKDHPDLTPSVEVISVDSGNEEYIRWVENTVNLK